MKKIGLYLILLFPLCTGASPTVSNIQASQCENSKLVDIYYDVAYSGSSNVSIVCEVSTNSGATFDLPAKSFTGDIGVMVPVGINRHIIWNAGVDWDENYSEQVKVRITAKAPRFTDNGDGSVTDNQTGLMWWKTAVAYNDPKALPGSDEFHITWWGASAACATLGKGWRLPTHDEVASLLDTSRTPHLPKGHPFDVPFGRYWMSNDELDYGTITEVETFSLITTGYHLYDYESLDPEYPELFYIGHYVWPVRSAD